MNSEWDYMWSIVRGGRQGDIYELGEYPMFTYMVMLMEHGTETTRVESNTLDYCREVAEEFVQGEVT